MRSNTEIEDLRRKVTENAQQATIAIGLALGHAVKAGKALIRAKERLLHGDFAPFVESCGLNPRTARHYMRLAQHWPLLEQRQNGNTVAVLSVRAALAAIADLGHVYASLADLLDEGPCMIWRTTGKTWIDLMWLDPRPDGFTHYALSNGPQSDPFANGVDCSRRPVKREAIAYELKSRNLSGATVRRYDLKTPGPFGTSGTEFMDVSNPATVTLPIITSEELGAFA
ncbi:hypothetical protein [Rhodoplanes azumiensis]|uniref:DUF3102 domain-containing protein n=1 Tax=Rhodoplanes azumiensis TaxID=1897628 RepID=A0ABW5AKW7_9BRAD